MLRRRRRREDLDDIETDADRRVAASERIAAVVDSARDHAHVQAERVERLRRTSERLAKQNRIGKIIRDAF